MSSGKEFETGAIKGQVFTQVTYWYVRNPGEYTWYMCAETPRGPIATFFP